MRPHAWALTWILAACVAGPGVVVHTAAAQGKAGAGKAAPAKSADPAAKEKDKEKEKARTYIKSGNKSAGAGKWEDAYAEYAIAWSIAPDWETAYPVGKAAFKTGHFAEAFARLTFHLQKAAPDQVPQKQRTEVETMIGEAKAKTAALTIKAEEGTEILLDNETIGRAPLAEAIYVDPGKHKIETRRGTSGETKTVEVTAGASVDVSFEAPKPLPTVTAPPIVTAAPTANPIRLPGLITGGVLTAGGLAVGGAFLGLSFGHDAAIQKAVEKGDKKAAEDAATQKAVALNTSLWGFVGAGVAAAGTVAFYFITRPSKKAEVKGAISVSPQGPALVVEGQF